ncbi:MAG: OmpA family protein [Bacteroidetes bacterium]|nr:OmpA family protein [Bacteroidota bacterium]MCB1041276.1 OmpA family protein [Acidimicrobiales bacterium]MCB9328498.1 OmpA family protein [Lewinellaceae bacterium]
MQKVSLLVLLIAFVSQSAFAQNDKEGSKDHPLIQRFKQSYIYDYEVTSFEPYSVVTGKSNGTKLTSTQEVEGKVYRIFYSLPTDAGSVYEIYTNYLNAFKNSGAEILFSCKNLSDCGRYFWDYLGKLDKKMQMPAYYGEELAYLAAKFSKDGMAYYVTVIPGYGLSEMGYEVTVVEAKEMSQQITLGSFEKAMNEKGKVSLYGILFDTGSDVIKQSSYAEIELIAQYLKNNPGKKVYIVGHTDNTGGYELNMKLSEKRALSVINALTSKNGISSSRLTAAGVGPVAPESVNTTEEGRKKNRRVEVVLNEN